MILNQADDVRLGERKVDAVYLGDQLVWSREELFVQVDRDLIWFDDENDVEVVEITSNTDWIIT